MEQENHQITDTLIAVICLLLAALAVMFYDNLSLKKVLREIRETEDDFARRRQEVLDKIINEIKKN
jgi:hypothetical protein